MTLPIKSHYAFIDPILVALAEKGHRVYSYSPFPKTNNRIANYYDDVNISDCFQLAELPIERDFFNNPIILMHAIHTICVPLTNSCPLVSR